MPILFEDLEPIWNAFIDLHKSRQVGFGAAPLAVQDIVAWIDFHGVTEYTDRHDFYHGITHLDAVWLERMRTKRSKEKQQQQEEQKKNANAKSSNRRTRSR